MKIDDLLNKIKDEEVTSKYPWCKDYGSIRSAKKEIVGDKICKSYNIFCTLYKERAKQITDETLQKSGIDYKTFTRNIDLKVSIGDFTDDDLGFFECIPIELYQNNKKTFTEKKATTDLLFLNINLKTNKLYFVSVPYDIIMKIVDINTSPDMFNIFNNFYVAKKQTSYNGSGLFIKLPIKRLFNIPGTIIQEYSFDEDILNIL